MTLFYVYKFKYNLSTPSDNLPFLLPVVQLDIEPIEPSFFSQVGSSGLSS
jgi:hypothetical protein